MLKKDFLKKFSLLVRLLISMSTLLVMASQNEAHASQWIKVYENRYPVAYLADLIQQTSDGGYILGGKAYGDSTAWIAKLDVHGNILWEKILDGYHYLVSIRQTGDDGYIIGLYGYYNQQKILKLDSVGTIEWQKVYQGGVDMYMNDVRPTSDGGYIAVLMVDNFGYENFRVNLLKLNEDGSILWQRAYGNDSVQVGPSAVRATKDEGYVIGNTVCNMPPQVPNCRATVLKVDAYGNMKWQKQFVTSDMNRLYSIEPTMDGGYIVAASIRNFGAGWYDAWVLKLDHNGDIQWQNAFGGGGFEEAYAVKQGIDGNYVIAGSAQSFKTNLIVSAWLFQLNPSGAVISEHTYGDGTNGSDIYSLEKTPDGGFIVEGVQRDAGLFLMKTDNQGQVPGCALSRQSHAVVTGSNAVVSNPNLVQSKARLTAVPVPVTLLDTSTTVTDLCYGVTLLSPDGGEAIDSGSVYPISWQPHPDAASYSLKYSTNNGLSWLPIASNYASPDTYNWWVPVPQNNKANCLVKIAGYNARGKLVGTDISKAPFAIEVVNMVTPDSAGQTWTSGSAMTITWTTNATVRPVAKTELYYTKDAAVAPAVWEPIAVLEGNPGSHAWTVPAVGKIKANCKLKIVLKDKAGNMIGRDVSDMPFTVMP